MNYETSQRAVHMPANAFPTEAFGEAFVIGVNPAVTKIDAQHPCPITFEDSAKRKYQIIILKAANPGTTLPQKPIWAAHPFPKPGDRYDPTVLSCPTKAGYVPPAKWCGDGVNETSIPQTGQTNGRYEIAGPPPLKSGE